MGAGRFVCVALPLILTIAAIIALLVATLAGVTNDSLYIFRVDVSNLSISPASVGNLAKDVGANIIPRADLPAVLTNNITAGNLGLDTTYEVNLWGYCTTNKAGDRECTKAQFDWASHRLNTTWIENFGSAAGVKVSLPDEVKTSLQTFSTVTKWTEVAFIIALVALAVELVVGILANCSRVISCLTWLIACIAAVFVGIAAGLATAMGTIVIGVVKSTAQAYGVQGNTGSRFLAAVWIATAFAIGAAFFWLFTVCCCKPEHRSRGKRHLDDEKLFPQKNYAPVARDHEMSGGYESTTSQSPFAQPYSSHPPHHAAGAGRPDIAYEPYSHRI